MAAPVPNPNRAADRLITADYEIIERNRQARKERKAQPHLSNHKTRSRWFQSRATWPVREAPIHQLIAERERVVTELPAFATPHDWTLLGPTNIGGRMTSIVCHPGDPDSIWVGAAGGGVWQSLDAGQTWSNLWHQEQSLNVGSLAIDPQDAHVLYCGTGEANLSADSYPGVGMYRTTDGGKNWTLLAASDQTGIPTRIGIIAIDPFDSRHLVIGGIGYTQGNPGGIYVSRDHGQTWRRKTFITQDNYWCHAIVFHPTQQGIIYATFTSNGWNNGIWRTTDGGRSWHHLMTGLPDAPFFHRTSLAISQSEPDILYALAAGNDDGVLDAFKTIDGGDHWESVGGGHFREEAQMRYNNTIAVHPQDPDLVICGGVDLHRTSDGGQTWHTVTHWYEDRGNPHYAHADHHALCIPPNAPDRIYDMNDGGMDISEDRGRSWDNRSTGLSVTMFYDLEVSQSDGRMFGGGAQDNGTLITITGQVDDYFDITGGDGGWLVIDPADTNHLFASIYNMNIFRFRGGQGWKDVSPPASDTEKNRMWMVFITMSPVDSNTVFTGSNRVWLTIDDGDTWQPVSANLDDGDITAIEVARADANRVYVGTENGGIFASADGGYTWSANIATTTLPGYMITRIATKPDNPDMVFVTVANFGHSHVFRSDDGGMTWHDIDQGRLPDVPHHAIAMSQQHPNRVFVCSDAGVFVSDDLGQTWQNLTKNLPNTNMVDLVYHAQDDTLSTATYGRSIWRIQL